MKNYAQNGFTLIEIMLSIAIMTTMISIAAFGLSKADLQADLNGKLLVLISDIKNQQIKSMSGETGDTGTISDHGIYFSSDSYTLFRGSSYDVGNPTNFEVEFDSNLAFQNIEFVGTQIIFSKLSGEVQNYDSNLDRVTLVNIPTNESKTIELNKYGAVTYEQ